MSRHAAFIGFWYFLIVFAAGFVLGTIRILVLEPSLGDTVAVIAEGPIILTISWLVCRWLIGKFGVAARRAPRLTMGMTAFALLLLAETGLAIGLFGRSLTDHFQSYGEPANAIGLAGQIAFGLFPFIQMVLGRWDR